MNQYLANGSTPESVDRIGSDRLTTRYNGNDDCTRTAWDGECSKATQTHDIELYANWTNQSTLFESDQLLVKIATERQVWEPVDRIGIIAPFTDVRTVTLFMVNFTVGNEQNSVEVEATIWSNSTRSGDWPNNSEQEILGLSNKKQKLQRPLGHVKMVVHGMKQKKSP